MRKKIIALAIACSTLIAAVLSGCNSAKSFDLPDGYFTDTKAVNNDLKNNFWNDANYYDRFGIARSGDVVYLRTYEVRSKLQLNPLDISDNWYETDYRIDENGVKKIYEKAQETGLDFKDTSLQIYDGKLLDFNLHCSDSKSGNPEIWYLNESKGAYEPLVALDIPNATYANFYVIDDGLYVVSENNIYEYKSGEFVQLPIDDSFTEGSFIFDSVGSRIYYENYSFDSEDSESNRKIYCYDVKTQKPPVYYDFSKVKEFESKYYNAFFTSDNYFYLDLTDSDSYTGHHSFYRLKMSDMTADLIFETDNSFSFNVCNDCAYVTFFEGKDGLYKATPDSNELTELCSDKVVSVDIIDDKWVYFTDEAQDLYRILPDGSELAKVTDT